MVLYFLIRDAAKNVDELDPLRAARLVRTFAVTLFLVTGYIGTFASEGAPAVTVIAVLLFIQVDMDILP